MNRLRAGGQHRAARIVSALPAAEGILDPAYVDALGLRVHRELQRLGEELQFGRRVAALLCPVIETMRRRGAGPVSVVDVGCGLGFVVRAMAASLALGPDVREPVSRHDGVVSARRAYTASVLEAAARTGAPEYDGQVQDGSRWHPRALDVLRPVVGIRA